MITKSVLHVDETYEQIINRSEGNLKISLQENVVKNRLFSVSEGGARANVICLSISETAKTNGIDYYEYLKRFLTDLPNFGTL